MFISCHFRNSGFSLSKGNFLSIEGVQSHSRPQQNIRKYLEPILISICENNYSVCLMCVPDDLARQASIRFIWKRDEICGRIWECNLKTRMQPTRIKEETGSKPRSKVRNYCGSNWEDTVKELEGSGNELVLSFILAFFQFLQLVVVVQTQYLPIF